MSNGQNQQRLPEMSGQSDEYLVTESRKGNATAFKELVERHEGKVAGVVKSILGDAVEASDVGQEVFIRFYEALDKFKGESTVSTYLIRIAINLSLNEIKKQKRKNFFLKPMEAGYQAKANDDGSDLKEMIQYEIRQLDFDFQTTITLRMIEGYSTEETAEILGIPLGTVLSRLSRAQKRLKVRLAKYL